MSEKAPILGEPQEEFKLSGRDESSLKALLEEANFEGVHFFLEEGMEANAIPASATLEEAVFALLPYEHPEEALDEETFRLLEESSYEAATLRDLLNFAIEYPQAQLKHEVVALGTLRTRRVFENRPGETVWDQGERDQRICQWAVGLSNVKERRVLVPMELYLTKLLRKEAFLLVKRAL